MFRNFYANQNMEDPRDSWYKPNLLYNIHYRPPIPSTLPTQAKPPALPRLIVVTKESNPSVCTCGKHCCKPHYRMEREVVWSSRQVRNEEDEKSQEKIQVETDVKLKAGEDDSSEENQDNKDDGTSTVKSEKERKSIISSTVRICNLKGMIDGLNETRKYETGVARYEDHFNTVVSDAMVQKVRERKSSPTSAMEEIGMESREECTDDVNGEAQMRDKLECDRSQIANESSIITDADNDEYGSTFGIMRVFCESGMHTAWSTEELHGYY